VRVVLRPEQLGIVEAGEGTPGTVVRHQYFGHDAMTHVATSGNLLLAIRHEPRRRLQPGDEVGITVLSPARAFEKDPKTPIE
jgi:ABC-type sugar transport system ATPase subunit